MTRKIWFVGAGPGDPELITVKARSLIEKADAILFAGSLVPLEPVVAGDEMRAEISGVGEVSIRFT